MSETVVLLTDFGLHDPYLAQTHAAILKQNPTLNVINLFPALADFDVQSAAYLIPAYAQDFPANTVFLCVVDPGVGGERQPLMVRADGQIFVAPDNGLLSQVLRRANSSSCAVITWRPERLSATFHGRDLFAPVAARLASAQTVPGQECEANLYPEWPDELSKVVYIDHYGNLITGVRASTTGRESIVQIAGHSLAFAPCFSAVPEHQLFWYENANGLVEIAANRASARARLNASIGMSFSISTNK